MASIIFSRNLARTVWEADEVVQHGVPDSLADIQSEYCDVVLNDSDTDTSDVLLCVPVDTPTLDMVC
jgi:hypothetical protein